MIFLVIDCNFITSLFDNALNIGRNSNKKGSVGMVPSVVAGSIVCGWSVK